MPRITWLTAVYGAMWVVSVAMASGAPVRFVIQPQKSHVTYISGTQLGEFRGKTGHVSGEALLDPQEVTGAKGAVVVDLRTVTSTNASLDRHMQEKLLETDRFPTTTFSATGFKPTAPLTAETGAGLLLGTLELHGVARPISVPVRFTLNRTTLQGEGSFAVNLAEFGMTPPRLLGLKVRDEVIVEIRLVATSQ